jgi:CubicO group peptidase (beta-lactamase class C family)
MKVRNFKKSKGSENSGELMLTTSDPAKLSLQNPAMKKRIDAVIDRAVREEQIVGAAVIAAQNGEIVCRRAAGFNDREAKKPLRQTDVFRLASITKLIVSVAALALIDKGKLGFNDAVTKYLPEFRPKLADGREPLITIRHLLTHTAGLHTVDQEQPDGAYHRLKVSDGMNNTGITLEENLRRIATAPLLFEPGTRRLRALRQTKNIFIRVNDCPDIFYEEFNKGALNYG